MDYTERKV